MYVPNSAGKCWKRETRGEFVGIASGFNHQLHGDLMRISWEFIWIYGWWGLIYQICPNFMCRGMKNHTGSDGIAVTILSCCVTIICPQYQAGRGTSVFFGRSPARIVQMCYFFEAGVVDQQGFQCLSKYITFSNRKKIERSNLTQITAIWFVCLPVLSFCGLLYTIQLNCHRHARILRGNLLTMNSHSKYLDDQWNSETPHYNVYIFIYAVCVYLSYHICIYV